MPAPFGNQNALGNKGGARGSAYAEKADAEILVSIWDGTITQAELEAKIKSKEYGAKHAFAIKCFSGDMKAIAKLMDKLFPNRMENKVSFSDDRVDEVVDKLSALFNGNKSTTTAPVNAGAIQGQSGAIDNTATLPVSV